MYPYSISNSTSSFLASGQSFAGECSDLATTLSTLTTFHEHDDGAASDGGGGRGRRGSLTHVPRPSSMGGNGGVASGGGKKRGDKERKRYKVQDVDGRAIDCLVHDPNGRKILCIGRGQLLVDAK